MLAVYLYLKTFHVSTSNQNFSTNEPYSPAKGAAILIGFTHDAM